MTVPRFLQFRSMAQESTASSFFAGFFFAAAFAFGFSPCTVN